LQKIKTISSQIQTEQAAAAMKMQPAHVSLQDNMHKAAVQDFPVQRKLSIGAVDDPLEHEADAMADTVMRMPSSPFSPERSAGLLVPAGASADEAVQRKCTHCEEEEQVQMKPITSSITPFIQAKGADGGTASDSVTNKINATRGSGSNMDSFTQSFMESRFGTDFSGVKIHTGNDAVQMSSELNAQAFTVGNDIYFNSGKYNPSSESGKHLLAHELTHTMQQSKGGINRRIQRVQLTYDDGPDPATQQTLDALKAANARATFYVVGQKVRAGDNWKIIFDIAASGNWLGNHALDWDFAKDNHIFLSGDFFNRASKILETEFAIREALIKGKANAVAAKNWTAIPQANRDYIDDIILRGTGRFRTPGFRSHWYSPGGGAQQQSIVFLNKVLAEAGLRTLEVSDSVTIDTKDWEKGKTKKDIEDTVAGNLDSNSDSILLHSRLTISAEATPAVVKDIKDKGFTFQEMARGNFNSAATGGFGSLKSSPEWLISYFWMGQMGPAVTVNVTDPVDRTVTRQTGLVWINYGSTAHLAVVHIENSSIASGTKIRFNGFIVTDLKDRAIAAATPNQPRGIQTLDKKYIMEAPDTAPEYAAKK
jgi:peptidoglycan/xylan/chitin deacetylase (PgdA/CDA1 family)